MSTDGTMDQRKSPLIETGDPETAGKARDRSRDFFRYLVFSLAKALDVEQVRFVSVDIETDTATSLALWSESAFQEASVCRLGDSPSLAAVLEKPISIQQGAARLFPTDPLLRDFAAESYWGRPSLMAAASC